jgi:hypothetical protein
MTVLSLDATIFAPISDLSATLTINQYAETESVTDQTVVRVYAGGVRRIVSTPGRAQAYSVSYRYVSRADYDALLDLVSVPILFRDQRARAIYGVITALSGTEFAVSDLVEDVSFTVQNITFSEIV